MQFVRIKTGSFEENCWILHNGENTVIIDPGDNAERISDEVGDSKVIWILLTHTHYDHLQALAEIVEKTKAKVAVHELEAKIVEQGKTNPTYAAVKLSPVTVDKKLNDGDVLNFGDKQIEVIHTPGHTPGSCCFLVDENLFAGDTLFYENCGRIDLEGGDAKAMQASLKKFQNLHENITIHSGHGLDWSISEARRFHFSISKNFEFL
jgi:hydroxyacylglutathione hydrolase